MTLICGDWSAAGAVCRAAEPRQVGAGTSCGGAGGGGGGGGGAGGGGAGLLIGVAAVVCGAARLVVACGATPMESPLALDEVWVTTRIPTAMMAAGVPANAAAARLVRYHGRGR